MTRRHLFLGIGAVAVLILVVGGVLLTLNFVSSSRAATNSGGDSARKHATVRVHVLTPQQGGVERTVTRPGAVHSFQYADLYAKVAGYLRDQVVDIGAVVKKDQILCQIYAPEIATNVTKAAADVTKSEAHVDVTKAQVTASQADLKEAHAKLEQSQADLENAVAMLNLRNEQYKRYQSLAKMKALQQELVDEKFEAQKAAESKKFAARKAINTAEAKVASAKAKVVAAQAEQADARAMVRVAKASLARAQVFEAYTKIRAPFDGIITLRSYHEGDYIREGAGQDNKPILTLARTDKMRVIVYVPDPDVPFTHKGDAAEVRIDSLPDKVFKGKVARTAGSEKYTTRTMRSEIDLLNSKGLLANGMFGSVTIHIGKSKHGLTIPSACLFGPEKEGKRSVYVVRDGKALQTAVLLGQNDGIHVGILSGLKADDEVVAQHDPGLANGVPVEVVKDKVE